MSITRPLATTLIASAVVTLVAIATSAPANAESLERRYVNTHRNPETPKPYCWTERTRVMVHTRSGWHWQTRRVRTCR